MEGVVSPMLEAVGSGITTVIGWVKNVVDALVTTDGALSALMPLFVISIAISAIMLGVKIVRGIVWGA